MPTLALPPEDGRRCHRTRRSVKILETDRLSLRRLRPDDAEFMLMLLNDPAFLRNVGDRGVRTSEAARAYIEAGPMASYEQNGFGLYLVTLRDSGEPIGLCGLVKREGLADVDLGFAVLPQFRGHGYAAEAAAAVLAYARTNLGLKQLAAIALPNNHGSIRILQRLGFQARGSLRLPGDDEELVLFASGGSP